MSDSASRGPEVGSPAPDLVVSGLERRADQGEPRVLAFVQDGLGGEPAEESLARDAIAAVAEIRAELRGLGAELVVVSPGGVWAVRADDPVEPRAAAGDALADEVAAAAGRYGVSAGEDAVF